MRKLFVAAAAWSACTLAVAQAAPAAERLRGTIAASDASNLTLHTAEGEDVTVSLAGAHFASVVASKLSAITPGSFIGTATKGSGSHMTALEVVVFPPELRGQGEGHYAWDKLPDSSGPSAGGGSMSSSMTNGTVAAGHAPAVGTTMTNGTIANANGADGTLHIDVDYKGGHKSILVPPAAPVVAFQVADASILKVGAAAFIVASVDGGKVTAKFVAVGKDGVKPPM